MHQYIDRNSSRIVTETLFRDKLINTIYSTVREKGRFAFDLLTSHRISSLVAWAVYDLPGGGLLSGRRSFSDELGINLEECLEPGKLTSPRRVFERKIRYWDCRPMDPDERTAVSPADSRVLLGSFRTESSVFLKEKFFRFAELLGPDKPEWLESFAEGDYAVFRLTPDKYHWNHVPVSGVVLDYYELDGACHSCNPGAVVREVTPYSKNRRTVTIIDTDVEGGSGMGRVAMIEVAALMIGDIVQCYSAEGYDNPVSVESGLFLRRGRAKSLYRPGSSVDILIFQKDRIRFSKDLLANSIRPGVASRYSVPFGRTIVETDLTVRSEIGRAV